jgi:O-antigen ligase
LFWGLIAAGIVLTESRGGILAAGVTILFLFGAATLHRRSRAHGRAATATAAALLLGVLFVATAVGAPRFYRFLETDPRDLTGNTRVALWKTSLAAWREFPYVGSGLGTFREAFRRVQPRELRGFVEQAHNDFLQLAVTGGAVGAALGALLFGSLFVLFLRAWARQRHREESAFALAGLGALLSLTLHGQVEFNLSIPVIPATLACVLGASWAAARRE